MHLQTIDDSQTVWNKSQSRSIPTNAWFEYDVHQPFQSLLVSQSLKWSYQLLAWTTPSSGPCAINCDSESGVFNTCLSAKRLPFSCNSVDSLSLFGHRKGYRTIPERFGSLLLCLQLLHLAAHMNLNIETRTWLLHRVSKGSYPRQNNNSCFLWYHFKTFYIINIIF